MLTRNLWLSHPKKEKNREDKDNSNAIRFPRILRKKPVAIDGMIPNILVTQEEIEESKKTGEKFWSNYSLGKVPVCKHCVKQPCFLKEKWRLLKFIINDINTLYPYTLVNMKCKIVFEHFDNYLTYHERTSQYPFMHIPICKEILHIENDPFCMGHKNR